MTRGALLAGPEDAARSADAAPGRKDAVRGADVALGLKDAAPGAARG